MKYFDTPEARDILKKGLDEAERGGYAKAIKDLKEVIIELEDAGIEVPWEAQNTLEYMYVKRYCRREGI